MNLTELRFDHFTAFEKLHLSLSPGINVFVGRNGTGKTHIMKTAYAACDITKTELGFADKLVRTFLPSGRSIGRLAKRQKGTASCAVEVRRGELKLRITFTSHTGHPENAKVTGSAAWRKKPVESVFIPVKEMLSNAPGFKSLYALRDVHFEEIYSDILDRAYRPALKGNPDKKRAALLKNLQKAINGSVSLKNEEFFLINKQGNLEFTLLAEGMRKLGLLWLLIQNGTLLSGSVLFWDEPEANLNPSHYGDLMQILLELQRSGVQIFLATHDYVILKELDLRRDKSDKILFHSLFHNDDGEISCHTVKDYLQIHPNAIAETFSSLYDREVERSLGGLLK